MRLPGHDSTLWCSLQPVKASDSVKVARTSDSGNVAAELAHRQAESQSPINPRIREARYVADEPG
jgi:hypothetical protein